MTYVELVCILQMHCQPFLLDTCTLEYDLRHHTTHFVRKFQDMDQYICFGNRLDFERNLYWVHIQDDNLYMDHLDILVHMNIHQQNIERFDRKEMDYMDRRERVRLLKIESLILLFKRIVEYKWIIRGGGFRWQLVNASPIYPSLHVQTGVWLITLHLASNPQAPGHGSLHLSLIHALLLGQSEFIVHSGRQFGGDPKLSDEQLHDGTLFMAWHWDRGPQGDGRHGLIIAGTSCWGAKVLQFFLLNILISCRNSVTAYVIAHSIV